MISAQVGRQPQTARNWSGRWMKRRQIGDRLMRFVARNDEPEPVPQGCARLHSLICGANDNPRLTVTRSRSLVERLQLRVDD